jgi:phosphatidylserine/phosphatidylglycerophosphate/cardiolipin synthase-like enzyme
MKLRRVIKQLLITTLAVWLATMAWQTHKPLPAGIHVSSFSTLLPESTVHFLRDVTYQNTLGQRVSEQQIFDAVFKQIDEAQYFVVLDFFLINDDMGGAGKPLRNLSRELADHLLARKRALPDLHILLVTDPINDAYGGARSSLLQELDNAGIDVVRTDLTRLRDSNPGYSAVWRGLIQWWGNSTQGGWLPNPFDGDSAGITLRSWLSLLNFKANHRKVIVTDSVTGNWVALVTSANPHDASSAHSNVALQFTGEPARAVFDSELQIADFSGWSSDMPQLPLPAQTTESGSIELSYLTEGAIRARVLTEIAATQSGDRIRMAMFYLSERAVVDALKSAAARGVSIQLILDPNKDAFGIEKDGVPNRPVANELIEQGQGNVEVRWYRTHGEQFHTKLLMVQRQDKLFVTLGSANFTRRNLDDYNLEANVALSMKSDIQLAGQFTAYFERLWNGDAATAEYSAPFGAYRDDSAARYWRYRVMEATGLSTF